MLKSIRIFFTVALFTGVFISLNSCSTSPKEDSEQSKTVYASSLIPFFDDWKLILGDGSNAGFANDFENKDFFYPQKTIAANGLFLRLQMQEILMVHQTIPEPN